jgi:hypothetical protein
MSDINQIKSLDNGCRYSFKKVGSQTHLAIIPKTGAPTELLLQVPDYDGYQTDRLPLPAELLNEQTAQAVFIKAVNKFIDRQGAPCEKQSQFPQFSVILPGCPAKAIWAQRLTNG